MKFNKGEWSELFVVASVFNNNSVKIATSNNHLKILKIYFEDKKTSYLISNSEIVSNKAISYPLYTRKEVDCFIRELANSTGASFKLKQGSDFIAKYEIPSVKEAKNKGDIDTNTLFPNESIGRDVNFSIKSFVGNPPTLLNSSQATNFIFEIKDFSGNIKAINEISSKSKIRDRIAEIIKCSTSIEIINVEDSTFYENLMKIDTNFLKMLSPILLNYYSTNFNAISDLVANTINTNFDKSIIMLNIKRFLRAFALGMQPKILWDGDSVNGGSIIVEKTGDLLAYTLYDISKFDDFLYFNCKFDTPSSSRHKFGSIYSENGKYYIKLNLQIRFK